MCIGANIVKLADRGGCGALRSVHRIVCFVMRLLLTLQGDVELLCCTTSSLIGGIALTIMAGEGGCVASTAFVSGLRGEIDDKKAVVCRTVGVLRRGWARSHA